MKSFAGLIKKEILISRYWYIAYLLIILLAIAVGTYFSIKLDEPSILIPFYLMLLPWHIFFMPLVVYSLLRMEGKTQIWLYNPQSSAKLLLAKITLGFIFQIFSQAIVTLVIFLSVKYAIGLASVDKLPYTDILFTNVALLCLAFYLSFWVVFYWTVYHSLGRFPALKNFRWIVIGLLFFAINSVEAMILKMNIFDKYLSSWSWDVNATLGMHYEYKNGWLIIQEVMSIPILPIIIYGIIALILFIVASKLLDRKVEV